MVENIKNHDVVTDYLKVYVNEERKKDRCLHRYVIFALVFFTITLLAQIIFDYTNEINRKKRADANQVEFDKAVRWYYDTTNARKP